jgi:hypothetical protein
VFPALNKVAPHVAEAYFLDHRELDIMTEGLAKVEIASDAIVAARATAELPAVLRIHLDKEDGHLYPLLREKTSVEEQTAIVGDMAGHVPPGRNPDFIHWFFTTAGNDEQEMWLRVVMGLMPEPVFAGVKGLVHETVGEGWSELTRRIPELGA